MGRRGDDNTAHLRAAFVFGTLPLPHQNRADRIWYYMGAAYGRGGAST
ncbi:hypothetical protein COLSTE_00361 [Collinsella stercoris DSM 13279]|uniref:Uncharacterized protein n=1 Tax=Collinsella stercoris DSM 13279 TaxID=445975 RepID=B6G8F3_9ACTN|nr:hypothetical protein COLSTE_00361 [Collinsella stercoris DSM 13279]